MQPNEALLHNWFYGNFYVRVAACVITSALMGSIPFRRLAFWFFAGLDPRLLSTARGLAPIFNAGKTFIPVAIATHGGGYAVGALSAVAAVGTDCFCPWFRFRDGAQGRAAQLGALAGFCWPAAVAFAIVWLIATLATNYIAAGTLVATAANILTLWVCTGAPGALAALAIFLLVSVAQLPNLERLLHATEPEMRTAAGSRRRTSRAVPSIGRLSDQPV